MWNDLVELVWPSSCAGCGAAGAVLCPACRPCRLHRPGMRIRAVRGTLACAGYPTGVARALRSAKYADRRGIMLRLSCDFTQVLAPVVRGRFDAAVPVPSPPDRRLRRGFSPARILAEDLAGAADLPLVDALAARPGPRQAGLDRARRKLAAEGRFRPVTRVSGRVLLVDDVVTTGATAGACAEALRAAGASEVWLAVLCAVR